MHPNLILYYNKTYINIFLKVALVVQRIELRTPNAPIEVRFLAGAHWKRARVVEWAALEMRYAGNGIGGSNPPASALKRLKRFKKLI